MNLPERGIGRSAALLDSDERIVASELVPVVADRVEHAMRHQLGARVQRDVGAVLDFERQHSRGLRELPQIFERRVAGIEDACWRREYPVLLVDNEQIRRNEECQHNDRSKAPHPAAQIGEL